MNLTSHDALERTVAEVVAEATVAAGLGDAPCPVSASEQTPLGDLQIDLSGRGCSKKALRDLASRLSAHPDIDRCVAVEPRLFVRLSRDVLVRTIESGEGPPPSAPATNGRLLVSYSSPNANKPLHLGHLRNNFLGMAIANLAADSGTAVHRSSVISDHGVHICQAVIGCDQLLHDQEPRHAPAKGDHRVGDGYVAFHRAAGPDATRLEAAARDLLLRIERGDADAFAAQRSVVDRAVRGIERTYARIGSRFDSMLRESDALVTARDLLARAVDGGVCARRQDGSIFLNPAQDATDEVTLQRADGTAVAYTQLMGAYVVRHEVVGPDQIWVVLGREWELGFDLMRGTLHRCRHPCAGVMEPLYHGMVNLSGGRMKSREGTVVEADELLDRIALRLMASWDDIAYPAPIGERFATCDALGLALLKLHFLRVRRSQDVEFDERSIWDSGWGRLLGVIRSLQQLRSTDARDSAAPRSRGRRAAAAFRELLLGVHALPRVVRRSLALREPAHLVRWLLDVADLQRRAGAPLPGDIAVSRATDRAMRRALGLLGVALPGLDGSPFGGVVGHVGD